MNVRNLRGWAAGALLAVGLLCARPVLADPGDIAVGGETLFTIKVPALGRTVQQRVEDVEDRLPPILGDDDLIPDDVTLAPSKGKTVNILVRKRLLVTVAPADGKANKRTARQQAEVWMAQIKKVLPRVSTKRNPNLETPTGG